MRSYGPYEEFYNTVRKTYGVKFVHGRPSDIQQDGEELVVRVEDMSIGKQLDIRTEYVVLSTGFVPDDALMQKLGLRAEGKFPTEYVNSAHCVDSNPRGIFFAGAAAFPKGVAEAMVDAGDAARGVASILGKKSVMKNTPTARINGDICGEVDCRICLTACPYGAVYVNKEDKVAVNEELCMGCGICTATCASGANQLSGYVGKEMVAQIAGMTQEGDVVAFLCKWGSYGAADKAGFERLSYPQNVKIIRVPCTGRVDAQMVLAAFGCGAKAVLIGGCAPESCHYFSGNFKARKRVVALQELIKQFGIAPEALVIEWIGKNESAKFVDAVNRLNRIGGGK
jgi:heterodisulfide reductase subunit A